MRQADRRVIESRLPCSLECPGSPELGLLSAGALCRLTKDAHEDNTWRKEGIRANSPSSARLRYPRAPT